MDNTNNNQPLHNGGTTDEVPYTKTPRFLGPPLKMGEIVNGDGSRFLPLGAGGPAPPLFETCEMKVETPVYEKTSDLVEPETPHVRFIGESPNLSEEPAEEIQEIIKGLQKCKITEKVSDVTPVLEQNTEAETTESVNPPFPIIAPGPPRCMREEFFTSLHTEENVTSSKSEEVTSSPEENLTSSQFAVAEVEMTVNPANVTSSKSEEVTSSPEENLTSSQFAVTEVEMTVNPTEVTSSPAEVTDDVKGSAVAAVENTKAPVMKIFECLVGMEGTDKRMEVVEHRLADPVLEQSLPHQTCILKSLPPLRVDKQPEHNSGSTPPNTPSVETNSEPKLNDHTIDEMFRDPARIPLGAGGPAPSTCHPLSKNGIPAQSPPRFPVPSHRHLQDNDKSTQENTAITEAADEGVVLRERRGEESGVTNTREEKVKSLPPEVAKKPARVGAIARLASVSGDDAKPALSGLSIAAPRRSHSFIGFSSPSLASSVAGSVHAHRQQFLQRRLMFEQPQEVKKSSLRKFQIELKALKLGNKSLCDSWVTEEKEDVQSPTSRSFQRSPLRNSFIQRRSTEKPLQEDEDKKEETK